MTDRTEDILAGIKDGSIGDKLTTPLSAEEIDALVEKAETDPGAPFESETIARMAATKRADLATFMRLRARLREAKINVGELDKALDKVFDKGEVDGDENEMGQGRALNFPEIDPWHEPIDGAVLLDEMVVQIERHVTLARESAVAIALWVVHTYSFNAFMISPRLVITSPEKRCGKTTLLRVVQLLVPRPLAAANITAAATFRTIEKHQPTLLIDEADTFLKDNEDLRGVINSGHERNGSVIRLVGDDHEPRAFSTYCPTVIAAIGSMPGTIEDRAFMIVMRRRLPSETIVRFRSDQADHLHELKRKAARWVADHEHALRDADPDMPDALHDRAQDNWRGALAIADLAGGDWPQKARAAAQTLSMQGAEQDDQSRGVMLLTDIRRVFHDKLKVGGKDTDRISSSDLVNALCILPDRPWATWSRGNRISAAAAARMLKAFKIVPNTIKLANGMQPNGYKRAQFDDAFARYLPDAVNPPDQGSPSSPLPGKLGASRRMESSPDTWSGEPLNSAQPLEKYGDGEGGELLGEGIREFDEANIVDVDPPQ